MYVLNIGLDGTTEEQVHAALSELGAWLVGQRIIMSDSEWTFVAEVLAPMLYKDVYRLASRLNQEAIAYWDGMAAKGVLAGTQALAWGKFDPSKFVMRSGARLSDVLLAVETGEFTFRPELAKHARMLDKPPRLKEEAMPVDDAAEPSNAPAKSYAEYWNEIAMKLQAHDAGLFTRLDGGTGQERVLSSIAKLIERSASLDEFASDARDLMHKCDKVKSDARFLYAKAKRRV